jgi:hypothetical protein
MVRYEVPAGDFGRPCQACGKNIYFVKTPTGKYMPIEWDGTAHWANCPERAQFKKPPLRRMDVEDPR